MNYFKAFAPVALLVASVAPMQAQNYKSVVVNLSNGFSTRVNLEEELATTFTDEYVVFSGGSKDVTIVKANVESFSFSKTAGIEGVADDSATAPEITPESIVYSNLPAGSTASVYTIGGQCLLTESVSGDWTYSFADLTTGVYLITVNGVTYKIAVR